jgi:hypothetical protein
MSLAGELRWRDPELNRGHHDFQSCALPAELSRHVRGGCILAEGKWLFKSGPQGGPFLPSAAVGLAGLARSQLHHHTCPSSLVAVESSGSAVEGSQAEDAGYGREVVVVGRAPSLGAAGPSA